MVSDEPCFPKICRLPKELTLVQSKRGKECAISTVADTLALRRHFRDIPAAGRLISALYYGTERLCERALATLNTFIGNPMLVGSTYYHPKHNILVGDCHPRNFRTIEGDAVPIDIIITEPEGNLCKFAKANVARA